MEELIADPDPVGAEATEDLAQLADDLRGVTLRDGYEYREAEPLLALASKILADRQSAAFGSGSSRGEATEDDDEREGRAVFGGDGRAYKSNNTSFPYRTFTWSEAQCSGTMIGPGTMVTAAHCVYDTVTDAWLAVWDPTIWNPATGTWGVNRWPRWAPGVDARDATAAPYGWQQCYTPTIPTAYVNENSKTSSTALLNDYAVFDFTTHCGVRPGDATGWMGTWIYSEASIESLGTRTYGYPQFAQGVFRYSGSVPNFFAEIWGMSAGAGTTFIDSPTTKLKTTLDTSGGQSGSSYWVLDGDYRVIGIHMGQDTTTYNSGRRFDATVYNFWDFYSPYPQQM
ncbi:MAG TPA: trypsin-like serine protease [Polyangiaceae bacterium]|nr:trypsin-like serine protease [Polyangiaceae bacterium]